MMSLPPFSWVHRTVKMIPCFKSLRSSEPGNGA